MSAVRAREGVRHDWRSRADHLSTGKLTRRAAVGREVRSASASVVALTVAVPATTGIAVAYQGGNWRRRGHWCLCWRAIGCGRWESGLAPIKPDTVTLLS